MSDDDAGRWTVLVPVKALGGAKTRLDPRRDGSGPSLAAAFLADVLAAAATATGVSRTIVVTGDPDVARQTLDAGADVVDDHGADGINTALRGASRGLPGPVAAIVSDLPCLTAEALADVLAAARDIVAGGRAAFVSDVAGDGTTMWCGRAPVASHFGPQSALRHRESGAVDLTPLLPEGARRRAQRDVDTIDDLADAVAIGVGGNTAAAVTAT